MLRRALMFVAVLFTGATAGGFQPTLHAQNADSVATVVLARLDSISAAKKFRFGLSLGWRIQIGEDVKHSRDVQISPTDSTVVVDEGDRNDVVLSGVVVAFPIGDPGDERSVLNCGLCGLGFVANLNLATFGPQSVTQFNQSIEGGLGIALALSPDFSLGFTVERLFSRRLRNNIQIGQQLVIDGAVQTEMSIDNDKLFLDDNLTAVSLKFIYFF